MKFDLIANLIHPSTIDMSYAHEGQGIVLGIKDDNNDWNIQGHRRRIIEVDSEALDLFAQLYDEPGTLALHARLPSPTCQRSAFGIGKVRLSPRRLGDLKGGYFSTVMWDETAPRKMALSAMIRSFQGVSNNGFSLDRISTLAFPFIGRHKPYASNITTTIHST